MKPLKRRVRLKLHFLIGWAFILVLLKPTCCSGQDYTRNPLIDYSAIDEQKDSASVEIANDDKPTQELSQVFPRYAQKYEAIEEGSGPQENEDDIRSVVQSSDFAVINSDIESFGKIEDIEEHLNKEDLPLDLDGEGTTVMLFNIFTPEEVSLLSSLVGEDVIEELVESDIIDNEKDSKNGVPSSQEIVQEVSSIRESLRPYKIIPDNFQVADESIEEEDNSTESKMYLVNERKNKMENLLNRLSDKYKRRAEAEFNENSRKNNDKVKKMKNMIDNLRFKLEDEEKHMASASSTSTTTTTGVPSKKKIETILGNKLRGLSVGVHRVNLEDILDMDLKLSNKHRLENPIPPPESLKRQALHPKLMHQRPQTSLVHRPSMNLKSRINPVKDEVSPSAVAYRSLPLISRYSPTPTPTLSASPSTKTEVRSLNTYRFDPSPRVYAPEFDPHPITKELPLPKIPTVVASDPFPHTKELPPYHNPSVKPYIQQEHPSQPRAPLRPYVPPVRVSPPAYNSPTVKTTTPIPSTLFYPVIPKNFDPTKKPKTSYTKKNNEPEMQKYISSDSYRSQNDKKSLSIFNNDKNSDKQRHESSFPPPSNYYKEPSLKFRDYGESFIAVTPKNTPHSGILPPNYGVSEPERDKISALPDPRSHYFPKSLQFLTGVSSTSSPRPNHYSTTTMKPPNTSYSPPHHISSTTMKPHQWKYESPQSQSKSPLNYDAKEYSTAKPSDNHRPSTVSQSYSTMTPPTYEYEHGKSSTMYGSTQSPKIIESPVTEGLKYLKTVNNLYDKYTQNEHDSSKYKEPELIENQKDFDSSTHLELIKAYQNLFSLLGFPSDFKSTFRHFIPDETPEPRSKRYQRKQLFDPQTKNPILPVDLGSVVSNAPGNGKVIIRGSKYPPDTEYIPPFDADHHYLPHREHKNTHHHKKTHNQMSKKVNYDFNDRYHDVFNARELPIQGYNYPISHTPNGGEVIIKGDHEFLPDTEYIPSFTNHKSSDHTLKKVGSQRHSVLSSDSYRSVFLNGKDITKDMMQIYLPPYKEFFHPMNSRMDREIKISRSLPPKTESHPHAQYVLPDAEYLANFSRSYSYSYPSKKLGYLPPPNHMPKLEYPQKNEITKKRDLGDYKYIKAPRSQKSNESLYKVHINSPDAEETDHEDEESNHQITIISPGTAKQGNGQQPHSINIEINIPTKDEINLLNGGERFAVNKKQQSPLIPEYVPPPGTMVYRPHFLPLKRKVNPAETTVVESDEDEYKILPLNSSTQGYPTMEDFYKYFSSNNASYDPILSKLKPPLVKGLKIPRLTSTLENPQFDIYYKVGHNEESQKFSPDKKKLSQFQEYLPPDKQSAYIDHSKTSNKHQNPISTEYKMEHKGEKSYETLSKKYVPPSSTKKYKLPSQDLEYSNLKNQYKKSKDESKTKKPENEYTTSTDEETYTPPKKEYLPPHYEMGYNLPSKEYILPQYDKGFELPSKEYLAPNYETGYELPVNDYLPPKYDMGYELPREEYLPPQHSKGYKPPSKEYILPTMEKGYRPPDKEYKLPNMKRGFKPPSKEYLPPQYHNGYNLPSEEYSLPHYNKGYEPPSKEYLLPEFSKGYDLPEKDYNSPTHSMGYKLPSKSYILPSYDKGYKIPDKEYLPPKYEMGYQPPSEDYIPPKDERGLKLPKKEYIAPKYNEGYSLPNINYDSPNFKKGYKIPNEEYYMPEYKKGYEPPDKAYSLPQFEKGYKPPNEGYHSPTYKKGYEPPKEDYLPPQHENGYKPPNKDYIPPNHKNGYILPNKDYASPMYKKGYHPPNKEYLLPKYKKDFTLPEKEYHSPEYKDGYTLPKKEYKLPKYEKGYSPPEKEYHGPEYEKGYSPPEKEYQGPDYKKGYSLPEKEYLGPKYEKGYSPPEREYHGPEYEKGYSPPKNEYHSPEYEKGYSPPEKEYHGPDYKKGYSLPEKEYLGPQYEKGYSLPEKEYLGPKYEKGYSPPEREYHGPEYEKGYSPPKNEYHSPKYEKGYSPPEKEYHGPDYKKGYSLPEKEYLGPQYEKGYSPPEREYHGPEYDEGFSPPNSKYFPPSFKKGYHIPKLEYESPHYEKGYKPPNDKYHAPKEVKDFEPPGKEYLAPTLESGYTPSQKTYEAPSHKTGYKLPLKDYHAPDYKKGYDTPNKGYLSPSIKENYPPTTDEYLPPDKAINENHFVEFGNGYEPPRENYFIPEKEMEYKLPPKEYLSPTYGTEHKNSLSTKDHDHSFQILDGGIKLPQREYNSPNNANEYIPPHSRNPFLRNQKNYHKNSHSSDDKHLMPQMSLHHKLENENLHPKHIHSSHSYDKSKGNLLNGQLDGYLPPSDKKPNDGYLPPNNHNHHDGYLPIDHKDHHDGYSPPDPKDHHDGYLPPDHKDHHDGYLPPDHKDHHHDGYLSPDHKNHHDGYLPPDNQDHYDGYLPPDSHHHLDSHLPPFDGKKMRQPKKENPLDDDYIPPGFPNTYDSPDLIYDNKPISSKYITPSGLGSSNLPDYIAAPSRGPQYKPKKMEYIPPPPRPIINSHTNPPNKSREIYIPPMTPYEVPKNYINPNDFGPKDDYEDDYEDDIDFEKLESISDEEGKETLENEEPFFGLVKMKNVTSEKKSEKLTSKESSDDTEEEEELEIQLPPIPTLPPQPESFLPLLENLNPDVFQELSDSLGEGERQRRKNSKKIPGKAGVDYPDFKTIPNTDFSCKNFILEGFYADTFTSCQVFHVCESGKRQSSFLCPKGTIFNQKHRVCDWWYNVKCEDSTEFYDLNLDLLLLEGKDKAELPDVTISQSESSLGLDDLEELLKFTNNEDKDEVAGLMDELLNLNGFGNIGNLKNEIKNGKRRRNRKKNNRRKKRKRKNGKNTNPRRAEGADPDLCGLLGLCGELDDSFIFPFAASTATETKVKAPESFSFMTEKTSDEDSSTHELQNSTYTVEVDEENRSPKMIEEQSLDNAAFPQKIIINKFKISNESLVSNPEWAPVINKSAVLFTDTSISDRTLNLKADDNGWTPFNPLGKN